MENFTPIAPKPSRRLSAKGFSLVEVTLAVGIMAFAFIAVFGLIPTGLNTFQKAMETSVGSQIAQRVIGEAQQTDFEILTDEAGNSAPAAGFSFQAPSVGAGAFRYFGRDGTEIIPSSGSLSNDEKRQVVYWVNTRIAPRTDNLEHLATVTVQVANNPGNQSLELAQTDDPSNGYITNLIKPAPGIVITTHSAIVSRNR